MTLDTIIHGDALQELKMLPGNSIDSCITSPPYWGLRDYGHPGQLGTEDDFTTYVSRLCDVFDEVHRVLKPEGTLWVNLGDTYGGRVGGAQGKSGQFAGRKVVEGRIKHERPLAKCLLQIPARFAIEMIARGWILRNELVWHKPNAMPQSIKDRFSVDYEKVYFFTKSKEYYFEQQFEKWVQRPHDIKRAMDKHPGYNGKHGEGRIASGLNGGVVGNPLLGRNKRSVWSINTVGVKDAHFAVYPEKLITPMVLAGSPRGGVIIDPFMGSGTTASVARKHGRHYVGIELNADYIELAEKRLAQRVLL